MRGLIGIKPVGRLLTAVAHLLLLRPTVRVGNRVDQGGRKVALGCCRGRCHQRIRVLDAGGVVSVVVGDARVEALARIVVAVTRRVVVIISAIAGVVFVCQPEQCHRSQ